MGLGAWANRGATPRRARKVHFYAQLAADRSQLRLLVVNNATEAIEATIDIAGWATPSAALVTTLAAPTRDTANPPFSVQVAPIRAVKSWADAIIFVALSMTVLLFNATATI